jgi:hypothetical protein
MSGFVVGSRLLRVVSTSAPSGAEGQKRGAAAAEPPPLIRVLEKLTALLRCASFGRPRAPSRTRLMPSLGDKDGWPATVAESTGIVALTRKRELGSRGDRLSCTGVVTGRGRTGEVGRWLVCGR